MAEIIYAVSGDIREELNSGMVAGDIGYKDDSEIRGTLITREARRATRRINSKLKGTYPDSIPFGASGDVPLTIQAIANDIGVFYVRRSKHPGPGPMSDDVKEEYWDKPMAELDEIISAGISLSELDAMGTSSDEVYHTRKNRTPIFDMDSVESQEVSPDLLDDIADSRG